MFRLSSHEIADRRILIVEDDGQTAEALRQTILGAGGTVVGSVATVEAGLNAVGTQPVDQVLIHIRYTTQTPIIIPEAFARHGTATVFLACHDDWFDFDEGDDRVPDEVGFAPRSSSAARR